MITVKDIKRIIAYKKARLEVLAQPDMWTRYTKNMECGEIREFKQSCIDDEIIIEALEKQTPKPKYYHYEQNVKDTQMITVCPECKLCTITNINHKPKYCCWCGQALEWNEKGGVE